MQNAATYWRVFWRRAGVEYYTDGFGLNASSQSFRDRQEANVIAKELEKMTGVDEVRIVFSISTS